jgi:hypothetical protein
MTDLFVQGAKEKQKSILSSPVEETATLFFNQLRSQAHSTKLSFN